MNLALSEKANLEKTNYVRTADNQSNYWVSFYKTKLDRYVKEFGNKFFIVIIGQNNLETDFFAIPFGEVQHVFQEEFLYEEPKRWMMSVLNNQLLVRKFPYKIDVGQFYGNWPITHSRLDALRELSDEENEYSIENRKIEIEVRLQQSKFRRAVLENFESKCCISGVRETDLLVASHIVPWAERIETRLNPSNGICFLVLYDKLFDKGYFSIDSNLKVIVSQKKKELSDQLNGILSEIEGKKIALPIHYSLGLDFLDFHRQKILKR